MPVDLSTQTRDLFTRVDERQEPISLSEITALAQTTTDTLPTPVVVAVDGVPGPQSVVKRSWWRNLGVAAAALVAVLVLVGGVAWLSRLAVTDGPADQPPITTTPTTTIVDQATSTTVAATATDSPGSWYRVPASRLGVAADTVFWDVANTPFGFVTSDDQGLLISEDGISWEPLAPDRVVLEREIIAVASSDLGTLVVGTKTAWFTPDGETWSEVDFPPDAEWGFRPRVAASSDEFVVAIASGLWVSDDGFGWVEVTDAADRPTEFSEIESTPFGFVAGGQVKSQEMVWTSSDGVEWTRWNQIMEDNRFNPSSLGFRISDVAGSGLGIVAVSTSGVTWYSKDGVEWHPSTLPDLEFVPNDKFVVGASESGFLVATAINNRELINEAGVTDRGAPPVYEEVPSAWFSPDGLIWTSVPHETAYESGYVPQSLQEVIPRGTGFLIVGEPYQDDTRDLGDAGPVWIYEP